MQLKIKKNCYAITVEQSASKPLLSSAVSLHTIQLSKLLPLWAAVYSSAPVFTGNTFQDLPRLLETANNTERYTRGDQKETRLVSLPPNAEEWEKDNMSACSLDPQPSVARLTSSCNNAIGRTVSFREGSFCDPVEIVMCGLTFRNPASYI
jgi:hypothetical protein